MWSNHNDDNKEKVRILLVIPKHIKVQHEYANQLWYEKCAMVCANIYYSTCNNIISSKGKSESTIVDSALVTYYSGWT